MKMVRGLSYLDPKKPKKARGGWADNAAAILVHHGRGP